MDGENNGKPLFKMDDLGGKPTIFGNIHVSLLLNDVGSHPNWLLNPGLFPIQRTLPQIQPLNTKK